MITQIQKVRNKMIQLLKVFGAENPADILTTYIVQKICPQHSPEWEWYRHRAVRNQLRRPLDFDHYRRRGSQSIARPGDRLSDSALNVRLLDENLLTHRLWVFSGHGVHPQKLFVNVP